jgi:uncharacterized protein (DUF952 family)
MHDRIVYKIAHADAWAAAEEAGRFEGSPVDLSDGYIHFSTAAQVHETARRHFAGRDGLLLVAVDTSRLGAGVKWEPSRGGDLFPHLYEPLPMSAVLWSRPMPLGPDGIPVVPLDDAAP